MKKQLNVDVIQSELRGGSAFFPGYKASDSPAPSSQLETVYGKSRATTIRDNMDTQLFYRPGSQETAEYLERSLGRTSEYAHSHTEREGAQISQGHSEQGVPLLTAGEIRQLGDEDIIGFHRDLPPFRGKRMDWRQFPTLTERRSLPPPTLPVLSSVETGIWRHLAKEPPLYIDPDMVH